MAWVEGNEDPNCINMKDGVTNESDIILGFGGSDTIFGLGGNDFIYGQEGDDHLFGGNDNDFLQGGVGFDELDGGDGIDDGADYIDSWEGVAVTLGSGGAYGSGVGGTAEGDTLIRIEVLRGSFYDDYLVGNEENNGLVGQAGDDTLKGGGGGDGRGGGDGIDIAAYNDSLAGVSVSLITESGSGGDAEGDWLRSIENLTGSAHSDTLVGNNVVNVLQGMDGGDTLKGWGGADTLIGDGGQDYLDGGADADTMAGGLENDTYIVDTFFDAVTEFGGQGIDVVRTSVSWTMTWGADIEILETTDPIGTAAIFLVGNASGNRITGNDGDNQINGGGGGDQMIGRGGNDTYWVDNAGDQVSELGGQGLDEVRTR